MNDVRKSQLVFEDSSMGLEFKGIFNRFDIEGEDHTMLYLGGSDMLYYPNGPMSINAFRGYFILYGITAGDPANPTNVNTFKLNFDGDATEIVTLSTDSSDTEDSWYTLSGMKLTTKPTVKGIYINNGQKSSSSKRRFWRFLPDIAVLASRLASCCGINHQLRQPFVAWSHDVVQIE